MFVYHVQVELTNYRQVEVASEVELLDEAVSNLAETQAQEEYGEHDQVDVSLVELMSYPVDAAQHRVKNDTPSATVSGGKNSNDGNSQE